jgi:beta-lactam-binding protein with PASTA domain
MTSKVGFAVALALLSAAAGCGTTKPTPAPDVTGLSLNAAEDALDAAGLRYRTVGGGAFGIIIRSRWAVCAQSPAPRAIATTVTLTVARICPTPVPDVVGDELEAAEAELAAAGIAVHEHSLDDEPILVRDLWTVCRQEPPPGTRVGSVELYAAHDCWDYAG